MNQTILKKIFDNAQKYPDHNAIWVDDCYYTYRELLDRAMSLANLFQENSNQNSFCAILADKTIFAYQSILATLISGNAYVPLNPNFPVERNILIMEEVTCNIICVDVKQDIAVNFLEKLPSTTVCLFKKELYEHLVEAIPKHKYLYWNASKYKKTDKNFIAISQDQYAYLMFTSGSTGKPKGIAIKHDNLLQYINSICEIYKPIKDDRFSQLCELTFDLSIHEIFVCWVSGATLYVVPDAYILGIKRFIKKHAITYWTSVPSNITLLSQLKQLEPNCFPSIKWSFFCGEAFLNSQAQQWNRVATNSQIANLYGPTEATVSITYFNWHSDLDNTVGVPIGIPFSNQFCSLIDAAGQLVKEGDIGELCLAGSQVIEAYWNNSIKSKKSFNKFTWDKEKKLWYRTGDLAKWVKNVGYIYHGRIDDQWQIRGYRVEKLEIENELRKIAKNDGIAIVPIQSKDNPIQGVIAFISEEIDAELLLKSARQILPNPMIPKKIICLKKIPQNVNGKIDYIYLKNYLESVCA